MRIRIPIIAILAALALTLTSYADDANQRNQDVAIYEGQTVTLTAKQEGVSYDGQGKGNKTTDTRTEEEKNQEELERQKQAYLDEIARISDEIDNGLIDGDGWSDLGGSDWVDTYQGDPGTPSLPDWSLGDSTLPPGTVPSLDELWDYFTTHIVGEEDGTGGNYPDADFDDADPSDLITGGETTDKEIDTPQADQTTNGLLVTSQSVVPMGALVIGAAPCGTDPISLPELTVPEVTFQNGEPTPIPSIDMLPLDYQGWFEDWVRSIFSTLDIQPGSADSKTEEQFIRNPNIDDAMDMFDGIIVPGIIPGTDISVGYIENQEALYQLLLMYMQMLQNVDITSACVTKFTVYQITELDIQTIHTRIPSSEYRWVVTGPGGTVEKTTDTPYAKLLFRSSGVYDVDIFNTQTLWRNNKVSGEKSEIWVLSNGGFFDGLVVYQNTTRFNSYVSEDIGPTIEEVRMVDDSFTANVSESMLNKIQLIDQDGNIRAPSDDYTTQRG